MHPSDSQFSPRIHRSDPSSEARDILQSLSRGTDIPSDYVTAEEFDLLFRSMETGDRSPLVATIARRFIAMPVDVLVSGQLQQLLLEAQESVRRLFP